MSDLVKAIENFYTVILLSKKFPEKHSLKEKLLSVRALKQHFAERKYLAEKKTQILCVTHALASVAVFKRTPDPPKTVIDKVIESIERAVEMDPDLFKNESLGPLVHDAISFRQDYGNETGLVHKKG